MSNREIAGAAKGARAQTAPDVGAGPSAHPTCRTCFFKSNCLPATLDGERLARFEQLVWRASRPLKAGHVLVRQGNAMHTLYTVRVGSLKAVIDDADGAERVVGFRFPGAVIGLAEPEQRSWARTFVALEDTGLCHIPLRALDDALRRQLVKLMSERLRYEYSYHLTLAFKSSAEKLATFLLEISESCRRRNLSAQRFRLPMSYTDVASYLGMRNESVSRTLGKLQRDGLLQHQGKHIHIRDLRALAALRGE